MLREWMVRRVNDTVRPHAVSVTGKKCTGSESRKVQSLSRSEGESDEGRI
jgi:hypothetical protein